MSRSLTVTWQDPLAAFAAGKGLSGLDYMNEMIAGRIPPPPKGASRTPRASCSPTAPPPASS